MKNEYAEMEDDVSIEKTLLSAKRWIRYIHEVRGTGFPYCYLSWRTQ